MSISSDFLFITQLRLCSTSTVFSVLELHEV